MAYSWLRAPNPDALSKIAPAKIYLTGRVISEPDINAKGRSKFEFKVFSYTYGNKAKNTHPQELNAKTLVNIYDRKGNYKNIKLGDILEIKANIKNPYEATNPGQFDYKKYLEYQRIYTISAVKANDFSIIKHPDSGIWFVLNRLTELKNKIIEKNRNYLKSPHLEVLEGLVFGNHAVSVPNEIKQEFLKSGLLHLLAASGMNVGFIFGFWYFFASLVKIPYKPKIIGGMLLVALYSIMTGLPPSVTRAAIMAEFILFGKLLDRKADNLMLLILVCALMLLVEPLLITNISFQLSFITTFGILLCTQPLLEKTKPMPEAISGTVLIPIIAQTWASPIQIFHFNNFAVYSVLANVLVIPFIGILTYIGFVGNIFGLLPLIGDKICWLAAIISEPLINIILFISHYFAGLSDSLYYFAKPTILQVAMFYGLIAVSLLSIKKDLTSKTLNTTALILLSCLVILVIKDNFNKNLELVFFDVGQGDAIYVHTPNNKNFLVDTGPTGIYTPAKSVIIPYLRSKGINTLDAMFLTHDDSDHIGGTTQILKNIPVKKIYHSGIDNQSKTSRKLKDYITKNRINNKLLNSGEIITLDRDLIIKVIRSKNVDNNSENEDGLVLYIVYENFSALLMADCEAESLEEIKKYVKHPIKILKVGHHGSKNAVNESFLYYLKPQLAVISVGKKGYSYGHPNNQVLTDLKFFGATTLRTDKDNAITVNSNGNNYNFETYNDKKAAY